MNKNEETIFRTVYEGPDGVMMLEQYLNDNEAEKWLKGLEERKTISSRKDYKRWPGGQLLR